MNNIEIIITILSLLIWVVLIFWRGQFWRTDQKLEVTNTKLETWPSVRIVIPARNEATVLPISVRSLLKQNYPGDFSVILVDDGSTDGTADVARQIARDLNNTLQLDVIEAAPLPAGWTGKLWALEQGTSYAQKLTPPPDYLLLTDADIEHNEDNLRQLVVKAETDDLDLVSLMVLLRCQSFWEKFLIPAFVFFFQKLYPFRWVNDPNKQTAAAAGGCILIATEALNRVGGIKVVRGALIDDCALATVVKSGKDTVKHRIWLGLSSTTRSLRSYPSLATIWDMVARTAFTQLNYSPLLLLGTVIGMVITYLVPPAGVIFGLLTGNWLATSAGLSAWLLMSWAYLPTLRLYECSPLWAFCLPGVAFLYSLMTLDSALRHWQGRGGAWKGRVYEQKLKSVL